MANSNTVRSSQVAEHAGLERILRGHFVRPWLQPLHLPSADAFERAALLAPDVKDRSLILDSGCGTGESTRKVSARHPGSLVFGIDRSAHRLGRTGCRDFPDREGNIVWVRAELETFWRLALERGWRLSKHFILYPNPWPKKSQVRKRWHAHPVFPSLARLGGQVEMRTNWPVYAQEFAHALEFVTGSPVSVENLVAGKPLSPFERKYAASGHELYRVSANLDTLNPGLTKLPRPTASG